MLVIMYLGIYVRKWLYFTLSIQYVYISMNMRVCVFVITQACVYMSTLVYIHTCIDYTSMYASRYIISTILVCKFDESSSMHLCLISGMSMPYSNL